MKITFCPRNKKKTLLYGTAVDIWSFGAIWFELLTGDRFVEVRSEACIVASMVCRLGPLPDELPVPNAA